MDKCIVTKIDNYQSNDKTSLAYPYIFIAESSDALPVTLEALEKGDIPVLIRHDGTLLKVASLKKSAIVFSKLLKVFSFTVYLSSDKYIRIKNRQEILECDIWRE